MTAKWTWLVYMAGDNNLEGAGREDLREMQKVGSTADVNVLVQFDTEAQKTMRYRVERGRATTLQTMRGVDCGDPKVLTDFIKWGVANFPAEKYAVIVWNHGGGWEDSDVDYEANRELKPRRASTMHRARRTVFRTTREQINAIPGEDRLIAIDCGAQDYLDNEELRKAIENSGAHVELLGCDACLMNMVEVAYEMRKTAKVMVGSEETEPGAGWPYTEVLRTLTATPSMSGLELGKAIVSRYGAWYKEHAPSESVTQSAFDLGKVDVLAAAVDGLAEKLTANLSSLEAPVALARARCLQFETPDYIDLGDFVVKLAKTTASTAAAASVSVEIEKVKAALETSLVASITGGKRMAAAKGASIFFPQAGDRLIKAYKHLDFGKHNAWTKFLEAYL